MNQKSSKKINLIKTRILNSIILVTRNFLLLVFSYFMKISRNKKRIIESLEDLEKVNPSWNRDLQRLVIRSGYEGINDTPVFDLIPYGGKEEISIESGIVKMFVAGLTPAEALEQLQLDRGEFWSVWITPFERPKTIKRYSRENDILLICKY